MLELECLSESSVHLCNVIIKQLSKTFFLWNPIESKANFSVKQHVCITRCVHFDF